MGFVNERISAEDAEKYGIIQINKGYLCSHLDWTIDRDRCCYLRAVLYEREERQGYITWNFFWRGDLIEFVAHASDIYASPDRTFGKITWNIERYGVLDQSKRKEFLEHEKEFFGVLKEAFSAVQLGGLPKAKPFDEFEVIIEVNPAFLVWRSKRNG